MDGAGQRRGISGRIRVTVFTTSPDKIADAKRFGARDVVINKEGAEWSKLLHAFNFALDAVTCKHELNRFIPLLKRDAIAADGVGKVLGT